MYQCSSTDALIRGPAWPRVLLTLGFPNSQFFLSPCRFRLTFLVKDPRMIFPRSALPRAKEALQTLCRQGNWSSKFHAFFAAARAGAACYGGRSRRSHEPSISTRRDLLGRRTAVWAITAPFQRKEPSRRDFLALFRAFYPGTGIPRSSIPLWMFSGTLLEACSQITSWPLPFDCPMCLIRLVSG